MKFFKVLERCSNFRIQIQGLNGSLDSYYTQTKNWFLDVESKIARTKFNLFQINYIILLYTYQFLNAYWWTHNALSQLNSCFLGKLCVEAFLNLCIFLPIQSQLYKRDFLSSQDPSENYLVWYLDGWSCDYEWNPHE